jgi:hypothetical protein
MVDRPDWNRADLRRNSDSPAPKARAADLAIDRLQTGEPVSDLPLTLRVSGRSEGESVPARTLIRELLWQHYGLDISHPKVSRWLERRAPDVKYARAEQRPVGGGERNRFRVGPNGTVRVHLSLAVEDRLREVSYQYCLSRSRSRFGRFVKGVFGLS